jgi:hypothetical protein
MSKMPRHVCLMSALFFLINTGVWADPEFNAIYTHTPPKIDGRLNDQAYVDIPGITEFIQRQPNTGEPGSEPMTVYVLYDDNFLYIGFRCIVDPKKITANQLARDVSLGNDDRVQFIFDTFLDKRNGYWFQIGPKGSIGDALVSENGATFNKQWDGLWEGKAKINATGWEGELKIPFKTLNFKPDQSVWGMKIINNIIRKSEVSYWPTANLNSYKFQISDAGLLTGLQGITKGIGLDVSPYVITGTDNPPSTNTNYIRNENPMFNMGADIFYRLTSGIKAAVTINTDFAQTEADSRQINLTRFSLFFPEKRNFFLDGAQYFNFGISGDTNDKYGKMNIPYFSRSIGLDAEGNPIPILWGAKVTGQAGSNNIGLQTITDRPPDGNRNLSVARYSRNIGNQSYIGVIGTNGNAQSDSSNQLFGIDLRLATAKFKGNKVLAFTGWGMKSFTEGLEGDDFAWGAEINYPNDFLQFRFGHQEIGENYVAGIGFVPRPGIKENYGDIALGPRPNKYGILQVKFRVGADFISDFDNELLTREILINPLAVDFISGDEFEISIWPKYEYLDEDFDIFPSDSVSIPAGEYTFWRYGIEIQSAERRRIWFQPGYSWGGFFDGYRHDFNFKFGYKINTPIFVGMEYEFNSVFLPEGDFKTQIYRINGNVFVGPNVALENFVQYDNVTEQLGWQSRFRWILKPGNEILFVWNSSIIEQPEKARFAVQQSFTRLKINYNFRF